MRPAWRRCGAEPLHLYTPVTPAGISSRGTPDWSSAPRCSLRIEGNLNRFAAVSAWIERSARNGSVTEDCAVRARRPALIDLRCWTIRR